MVEVVIVAVRQGRLFVTVGERCGIATSSANDVDEWKIATGPTKSRRVLLYLRRIHLAMRGFDS